MDWARVCRGLAEGRHWTPDYVMKSMTIPQLWIVFRFDPGPQPIMPGRLRAIRNKQRLAKGLPPLVPKEKSKKRKR